MTLPSGDKAENTMKEPEQPKVIPKLVPRKRDSTQSI